MTYSDLNSIDLNFSNIKVLVVGDIMLDQYWSGSAHRISPEAPVPVVNLDNNEYRLGGAANVAYNLNVLGANVTLLGCMGNDHNSTIINDLLKSNQINSNIVYSDNFNTIVKCRILSNHQQIIRLDHEVSLPDQAAKLLYEKYSNLVSKFDAVYFSDYNKGCLQYIKSMIDVANENKIISFIDPKGDDFNKYIGATCVKPNFKELTNIVGKCKNEEEFITKSKDLKDKLNVKCLAVTRSQDGISIFYKNEYIKYPAVLHDVYDVTGAGDTTGAVLFLSYLQSGKISKAAKLSMISAGIVVSKVGAYAPSVDEINYEITRNNFSSELISIPQLKKIVASIQARGKKVVFSNGCFDVLHYGHTRFLKRAKEHGDYLIVAINSDSSIKSLKGNFRPIYTAKQRAEVLSSLSFVDFVVEFTEATPGKCVEQILPDVLIKGGENFKTINDIPESEGTMHVLKNGGKIILIDRTNECSSTDAIERLSLKKENA